MKIQLSEIIGTIQVNSSGNVWMICKHEKYDLLNDYLNSLKLEKDRNEQLELLEKLDEYQQIKSQKEQWNFFEYELGGHEVSKIEYGWISLMSQTPNLLLNKNTNELFVAYSINDKFKIEKSSIVSMIKNWGIILELLSKDKPLPQSEIEDRNEIKSMVERLNKYI